MRRVHAVISLTSLSVAALIGCSRTEQVSAPQPAQHQVVQSGGAELRLGVSNDHIGIAERIDVSLDVSAPPNSTIAAPEFGAELGEFTIVDSHIEPPRLVGEHRQYAAQLTLEPFLPGVYELPAFSVTITVEQGHSWDLTSQPVPIEVASAFDEPPEDPMLAFAPPMGVVDEPPAPPRAVSVGTVALIVSAGVAVVGALLWLVAAGRGQAGEPAPGLDDAQTESVIDAALTRVDDPSEGLALLGRAALGWLDAQVPGPSGARTSRDFTRDSLEGADSRAPHVVSVLAEIEQARFSASQRTADAARTIGQHLRHALEPDQAPHASGSAA